MLRKGFVFILIFCFWAGDVAATPTSPLGHLLRRVLTRQWQSYSKVPLAQRAFFMYSFRRRAMRLAKGVGGRAELRKILF